MTTPFDMNRFVNGDTARTEAGTRVRFISLYPIISVVVVRLENLDVAGDEFHLLHNDFLDAAKHWTMDDAVYAVRIPLLAPEPTEPAEPVYKPRPTIQQLLDEALAKLV